ncbi:hypothetical protein [Massilia sp. TN1-12]|uniref:hypothetical protein n=1 Tax=Massilia paldalensis TaxID=3377675 RepID=UPI00384D7CD7
MTIAHVLFPPSYLQRDAWFASAQPQLIAAHQDNRYQTAGVIEVGELRGEAAADECFDLTNNPGRQDQRDQAWPRRRSISVGDIVHVDGQTFLCQSVGWVEISKSAES